jgi:hypothetical protein
MLDSCLRLLLKNKIRVNFKSEIKEKNQGKVKVNVKITNNTLNLRQSIEKSTDTQYNDKAVNNKRMFYNYNHSSSGHIWP